MHAVNAGVRVDAHIKIDTGMSRIGFLYHDSVEDSPVIDEIAAVCSLEGLHPEGIFTHFADADNEGGTFTEEQYLKYKNIVNIIAKLFEGFWLFAKIISSFLTVKA